MATASGSISFTSIGSDTYSYSLTGFSVTWTSGSTDRSVGTYSNPIGTAACGSGSYGVSIGWSETINGTPTSGTFTFSGQVPACTTPPPPTYPPSWTDLSIGPFQAGVAYSDGVSASNMNYSGSYSISGGLPAGISFNASTGAITGTPTASGQSYNFMVYASNSYGTINSPSFTGIVAAPATTGKAKVWNGSAWVYGAAKVWDGSSWVTGTAKVWNGSAWVTSA